MPGKTTHNVTHELFLHKRKQPTSLLCNLGQSTTVTTHKDIGTTKTDQKDIQQLTPHNFRD